MDRRCLLLLAVLSGTCLAVAQVVPQSVDPATHGHRPGTRACESPRQKLTIKIPKSSGRHSKQSTFDLCLPRYLKNPDSSFKGGFKFVRTVNDTCGLYAIVLHPSDPANVGPVPHVHYANEEWFLPTSPGDKLRLYGQARYTSSNTVPDKLRTFIPGQLPGFNVPPVKFGSIEVPYGEIGYSPAAVVHAWRTATPVTNAMAIAAVGYSFEEAVNYPQIYADDPEKALLYSGLHGSPTDVTGTMASGPDWMDATGPILFPQVTLQNLQKLQDMLDRGESCCGNLCY